MGILKKIGAWLLQILISFDQFWNAIFLGWADETISSRSYREGLTKKRWKFMEILVNCIFFWQPRHCYQAYVSEQSRLHLPPALRDALTKTETVVVEKEVNTAVALAVAAAIEETKAYILELLEENNTVLQEAIAAAGIDLANQSEEFFETVTEMIRTELQTSINAAIEKAILAAAEKAAQDAIEDAKDKLEDLDAEDVKDKIEDALVENEDAIEDAKDKIEDALEENKEAIEDAKDKITGALGGLLKK